MIGAIPAEDHTMHTLQHTLDILERTPRVLDALLSDASEHWTHGRYGEGTWSAFEVVGHLIAAEKDDWMPRLRRILADGESRPFDPFAHNATAPQDGSVSLASLLVTFRAARETNLRDLRAMNLAPSDLARTGAHPALGRVTAAQLLATWAVHDLHHIRQISLAMAWQYRDEVGPWREYLNTLRR